MYIVPPSPPHKKGPFLFLQYLCSQILTISSPLQSEIITVHIWNKIYHLTVTVLPHYRIKEVQFCYLFSRNEKKYRYNMDW